MKAARIDDPVMVNCDTGSGLTLNDIIAHRLSPTKVSDGYSMFKKKENNCVKMVLNAWTE